MRHFHEAVQVFLGRVADLVAGGEDEPAAGRGVVDGLFGGAHSTSSGLPRSMTSVVCRLPISVIFSP